ncbi:hypothetical protein KAR34_07595 [bacterium]|nr:hypothetical protein [bacterium]
MKKKFLTKDRILFSALFIGILVVQLVALLIMNQMQIELSVRAAQAMKYGFRLAQVAVFFWYGYQTVLKVRWIWIFAFMTIAAPYLNNIAYAVLLFQKTKKENSEDQTEASAEAI